MTFLPIVVVAIAAAFPPLRVPALAVLTTGFAIAWRLRRPDVAAWAATIPVAVSLADVESSWVSGGGGSWEYAAAGGGTRWQPTNSLEARQPGEPSGA